MLSCESYVHELDLDLRVSLNLLLSTSLLLLCVIFLRVLSILLCVNLVCVNKLSFAYTDFVFIAASMSTAQQPTRTGNYSGDPETNMSSDSDSSTARSQVNVNAQPRRRVKMATSEKFTEQNMMNIKIPPFWPEKPSIWFAQVEGQFAIANIKDNNAKFYHILATLDRQYAAEVEDILTGPPDYDKLKSELIKRLSVSRENKVKQLLMHEELGTRKPSQFLRHLQHLAGPSMPADVVRTIWTSRLPPSMQPIVASQPTLNLDALADLADRVNDIATPAGHVAAVTPSPPIDELVRQMAELTKQVSALTAQVNNRSRPWRRERSSSQRRRSPSYRSESNYRRFPICWYHKKHGTNAKKCTKPCDFAAGNAQGSQ